MGLIHQDRSASVGVGETEVVYVDSSVALDRAFEIGLPTSAEIRSSAPGLLALRPDRIVQSDAHMTPEKIWALDSAFSALHREFHGIFGNRDYDLIAARFATLEFQNLAYQACVLQEEDYSRPVCVIELSSEDADLDRMIRSPLKVLLSENTDLSVLRVPIETLRVGDDPRAPSPNIINRLRFAGLSTIGYRLAVRIGSRLQISGPSGRILVVRENELCKETAWKMILRGFSPIMLPLTVDRSSPGEPEANVDAVMERRSDIRGLIHKHVGPFLSAHSALTPLTNIVCREIGQRISRYEQSLHRWRSELGRYVVPGRTAILTNWLNDPEAVSLKRALEDSDVPMVFFQHGVTNEINWRMRQYEAQYGTSLCDLEFSFNETAASFSMDNRFRRGRAVAAGLPQDYYRALPDQSKRILGGPPIWYISTSIYVANHGQLEGVTDWTKCQFERRIVQKVLARCDHRITFKPYPGRRYEDPDPIETAVEESANIEMHRSRLDLRYVVRHARVLISSRSFSTPSWCLATGLPLIHIDIPDQEPLDGPARKAFEEGVFLFDAGAPDFHDSLLSFLNKPLEEIERLWVEKAEARKRLMTTFMSAYDPQESGRSAGSRAADEIIREIRSRVK